MWRPEFERTGQSSFASPVPVLTEEPTATPLVCVSFSAAWLPYVLGALQQLVQPSAWDTSDQSTLLDVQQRAMDLIGLFGAGDNCMAPVEFQMTEA